MRPHHRGTCTVDPDQQSAIQVEPRFPDRGPSSRKRQLLHDHEMSLIDFLMVPFC